MARKKTGKCDPKWPRPKTIAEAKDQIVRTFRDNKWSRDEAAAFTRLVTGRDVLDNPDTVRAVWQRMVDGHMILTEEENK